MNRRPQEFLEQAVAFFVKQPMDAKTSVLMFGFVKQRCGLQRSFLKHGDLPRKIIVEMCHCENPTVTGK